MKLQPVATRVFLLSRSTLAILAAVCVLGSLHAKSSFAEQVYRFDGQGKVAPSSSVGVVGEAVHITFDYKLSDFSTQSGSSTTAASWSTIQPVPIHAIGATSGEIVVQPLSRFGAAKFSNWQIQFDSGNETTTLQSVGLALSSTTALQTPIMHSLTSLHSLIFPEVVQGGIWTSLANSETLTMPVGSDSLSLNNYSWTLSAVPEPSAFVLGIAGLAGLSLAGRRKLRAMFCGECVKSSER
jgi:hypothetical protein